MLGILSVRGRSTYELVQYMRESNLRAIWSRAESQMYSEPKRLEQEGLAESSVEFQGERRRTMYRATRAGRTAWHSVSRWTQLSLIITLSTARQTGHHCFRLWPGLGLLWPSGAWSASQTDNTCTQDINSAQLYDRNGTAGFVALLAKRLLQQTKFRAFKAKLCTICWQLNTP